MLQPLGTGTAYLGLRAVLDIGEGHEGDSLGVQGRVRLLSTGEHS